LCTWWDVFEEAKKNDGFDTETLSEVEEFLEQPRKWQENRSK
jgi:orotate phosphoribosyltransferase